MLDELGEEGDGEGRVVEVGGLSDRLLEAAQEGEGVAGVVARELDHRLQLDDEAAEVQRVEVRVQRGVTQVLVDVGVVEFVSRGETVHRTL